MPRVGEVSRSPRIVSLDTEVTGLDLYHGCSVFLVTACDQDGRQTWWEWDVDPLDRRPSVPREDLLEIRAYLEAAGRWVLQNSKFDAHALTLLYEREGVPFSWDWSKVEDTLAAGHVLATNQPHDLYSMVLQYLGEDLSRYEDELKRLVNEARRKVQQARLRLRRRSEKVGKDGQLLFQDEDDDPIARWRIAEEGLEGMPSAKGGSKKDKKGIESESPWKADCWLPRALADELGLPEDHPYRTVTREYANADSACTLPLWLRMERELEARNLTGLYRENLRVVRATWRLERNGVTMVQANADALEPEYRAEAAEAEAACVEIAAGLGYELKLPKSGNNGSLGTFLFGEVDESNPAGENRWLGLEPVEWTEGGKPSLNKDALVKYRAILPGDSVALRFLTTLGRKRKRDTSLSYLDGYRRFAVPWRPGYRRLYPNLNPFATGTLRFSSSNPNSQNISKQAEECELCEGAGCEHCNHGKTKSLRCCFGPAPGREWWSFDYENIELRIPAYASGEAKMIELFERPDDPPYFGSYHLLNCSIIYPDLFWPLADKKGAFKEQYEETWYQFGKNFGFAKQYRCGEATGDRAARKVGAFRAVQQGMPAMEEFNQACVREANRYGWVETLPDREFGRGYPVMCSRSEYGRISPTIPLSYKVQSTAMWCTRRAMVRCQDYLDRLNAQEPGRDYRMVLQVHDEIVFDFPAGWARNLPKVRRIKQLMAASGDDIGVPLKVSAKYHPRNWGESEKVK